MRRNGGLTYCCWIAAERAEYVYVAVASGVIPEFSRKVYVGSDCRFTDQGYSKTAVEE